MTWRSRWATAGAVVMAVLAVLALGATVLVAQRALADAEGVVVRGEGDLLVAAVTAELAEESYPYDTAALERILESHASEGLRYVALVGRDGRAVVAAGTASVPAADVRLGAPVRDGQRVRLTVPTFTRRPSRGIPRAFMPPDMSERGRPPPPMLLALELEPPVLATLRRDLARIAVVGGAAGIVLLAFAVAWSRSASRLAAVEQKAAREQRLVALGSMSSVMAHELRNPLASLKGHAQLLVEDLEDAGDAKKVAKAQRVVTEAERIEALTTSLLDFVRDGPIERAATTARELATEALEHLDAERVEVRVDADVLHADGRRLARAVHNLVDNALAASPPSESKPASKVELEIATRGRDVVIQVRDRGPGIPAGQESAIFEPFVTTRVKGTGLGLAVARRIAEQHGGTLTASNREGGGAVFTLRLPSEGRT